MPSNYLGCLWTCLQLFRYVLFCRCVCVCVCYLKHQCVLYLWISKYYCMLLYWCNRSIQMFIYISPSYSICHPPHSAHHSPRVYSDNSLHPVLLCNTSAVQKDWDLLFPASQCDETASWLMSLIEAKSFPSFKLLLLCVFVLKIDDETSTIKCGFCIYFHVCVCYSQAKSITTVSQHFISQWEAPTRMHLCIGWVACWRGVKTLSMWPVDWSALPVRMWVSDVITNLLKY